MKRNKKGFTLIELLAVVVILGVLAIIAIPTITNVMKKAKEKTFESQARMLIGAARNASIENPSKICYTISELSNYVNKDLTGYNGSVLLDKENKENKIWLSKNPYIINGSIEEEIEVIELAQYQEASETCEDIEILACTEDPTSYTLVINPDGGIHDGNENNEGYEITKNGTKTITEPYKIGYAFDGWEITGTPTSFEDGLFVMGEENVVIRAKWVTLFTYTGIYEFLDDDNGNWRIKFFTSGTLTFIKTISIDCFVVGGGGGSSGDYSSSGYGAGGGGGGAVTYSGVVLESEVSYAVVIGGGGSGGANVGNTGGKSYLDSELTYYANGGNGASGRAGGSGGSGGGGGNGNGGNGGSNGSNGTAGGGTAGTGQGLSTREFGEASGDLYAGGGGGYSGTGGAGGGANSQKSAVANTGGGAGGARLTNTYSGGSGIIVIRNHR